jgi:mediator of RNA polymerase II transcription subunit 12
MSICNLAQAGFVARLADDYLDGILSTRALARPFVESCLVKLTEVCRSDSMLTMASSSVQISTTSTQEYLITLSALLRLLLQVRPPLGLYIHAKTSMYMTEDLSIIT